jgi:hypothetical protein
VQASSISTTRFHHQVAGLLASGRRFALDERESGFEELKLAVSGDARQHDETRMKLDVSDELAEVVCVVRHAHAILVDAELEDLRVRLAKQIPVSCTGGVVAAVVSDGDEPG